MSDHEYTPSSKFGKWFNDRLPLLTLGKHLTDYPTPKNLNLLVDLWGNINFLFNYSNCNRIDFSNALCCSRRSSFWKRRAYYEKRKLWMAY